MSNIKKIIAERLTKLRNAKGKTVRKAAKEMGIGRSTLSNCENEVRAPGSETLDILADYYNTTSDYIIGKTDFKNSNIKLPDNAITDMKWLPVLGTIPAGKPVLAQENIEGYHPIPISQINDNDEYFWLKVNGDSMKDADIKDGDLVLIRQQENVENGEIAVVMVNSHDATLKKVYKSNGQLVLQPANDNYEPIFVQNKNARIIGKKIGHYKID